MYSLVYSKQSTKDIPKLKSAKLDSQTKILLGIIQQNPFQNPPPYEKLKGNLNGAYSRRINRKHRLVYEIFENEKVVRVVSMWTHYEQ
jgi:Txe/YoeB family toxin of toxin-antitoxin system